MRYQKFLCMIGWHDWTKWAEETLKRVCVFTGTTRLEVGQHRVCQCCGLAQLRKLRG